MHAEKIPAGFALRHMLEGHNDVISRIAWSPDGSMLASASTDGTVRIWDAITGGLLKTLASRSGPVCEAAWSPDGERVVSAHHDESLLLWNVKENEVSPSPVGHRGLITALAWPPGGRHLACCGSDDYSVYLLEVDTGEVVRRLEGHSCEVTALACGYDGRTLASGSKNGTFRIWDIFSGEIRRTLRGDGGAVTALGWTPDMQLLSIAREDDGTIILWDVETSRVRFLLKGHSAAVSSLSFSSDGNFLASKCLDNTVRLWRHGTWEMISVLQEDSCGCALSGLAFHPREPALATLGGEGKAIRIWDLDYRLLLNSGPALPWVRHTAARIVFLGDSCTGKTTLAMALAGTSTGDRKPDFGAKIWKCFSEKVQLPEIGEVCREYFIFDLVPSSRCEVIGSGFAKDAAVGVVLFDPTHAEEPFRGVKASKQILRRTAGEGCARLLVGARIDRGRLTTTEREILAYRRDHDFTEFILTSAKTGEGLDRLREAIERTIVWERLHITSEPQLWKEITEYLLDRRMSGRVLVKLDDLRDEFHQTHPELEFTEEEFDTVVRGAEKQCLVWPLSFGDLVLLKPELVNEYASALLHASYRHPEGLGRLVERDILEARIDFGTTKRVSDEEVEISLLHTVLELLIEKEQVFREDDYLIFPSQLRRTHPEGTEEPPPLVSHRFAGRPEEIYAALVTRLFLSGAFVPKNLWKNAAEFCDMDGNVYGVRLERLQEDYGLLTVFFDEHPADQAKALFLKFIHEHLKKYALPDSVTRERLYCCPSCQRPIKDREAIEDRIANGKFTITCQFCDEQVCLVDEVERRLDDPELLRWVRELEKTTEQKKETAVGITIAEAKEKIGEFDLFIVHNSEDKKQVIALSEALRRRGLTVWLDVDWIPPRRWVQDVIQQVVPRVKSVAIVVGRKGLGKLPAGEVRSLARHCLNRGMTVITILLPDVSDLSEELAFLEAFNGVRLRSEMDDARAFENLERWITHAGGSAHSSEDNTRVDRVKW